MRHTSYTDLEEVAYQRLVWLYGPELGLEKAAGRDHETRRDLWLWRNIGVPAIQRMRRPCNP